MSKIFDWDGRKGTLIDSVSKTKGTLTAGTGGFKKTEKGMAMEFDGSATDIDSGITLSGVKTIVMYISPSNNTKILLDDGADKLEITGGSYSGTGLTENYVNNVDTDTALLNQWQMSVSEFSAGIDFSTDLEITPTASSYIAKIVCYDTVLTQSERNTLYEEFQHSYGLTETKRGFAYPKATDLSKEVESEVGSDLVAPLDFTTGWTLNGTGPSIIDADSFSSGTDGSGVRKNYSLGTKRYRMHLNMTSTGTIEVRNGISGSSPLILERTAGTNVSTTADYTFVDNNIYLRGRGADTVFNINKFTITELTGLKAAYNFIPTGSTLVDISGEGNNGTITGALSTKEGMSFDGVDDKISIPHSTDLSFGTGAFSVSFRAGLNQDADYQRVFEKSDGSIYYRFRINAASKNLHIELDDGTNDYTKTFIGAFSTDGQIQNYTLVVDARSSIELYVNGALWTNTTSSGTLANVGDIDNTSVFYICASGNVYYLKADVKDFKIYNYAFTAKQAQDYHNSFQQVKLRETFSDSGADGIAKNPREWQ